MWGFTRFNFKQMLKISAFYLEKQKSFIPKKIFFKPYRRIQKMALAFLSFSEGFDKYYLVPIQVWLDCNREILDASLDHQRSRKLMHTSQICTYLLTCSGTLFHFSTRKKTAEKELKNISSKMFGNLITNTKYLA